MTFPKKLPSAFVIYWDVFVFSRRTVPVILHPVSPRLSAGVSSFFNHSCCLTCINSLKGRWSLKLLARSSSIKGHASHQNKKKQNKSPYRSSADIVDGNKDSLSALYLCLIDSFLYASFSVNSGYLRIFEVQRHDNSRRPYGYC